MTSNQDSKHKRLSIPLTGIEVMNDLSIDAIKMFYLAKEGELLPHDPTDPLWINLQINSRCDPPEYTSSRWIYLKSDVEEFKLKHKELLEELQKQKATTLDESQKQGLPESGDQSKKRRSRSSDDREQAIMFAKKYIDQYRTKKEPYTCHDAAVAISTKLDKQWDLRAIKSWIKPYFPDEAKQPGRPPKERVKK